MNSPHVIMETAQICPECGATWSDGRNCRDDFHQMLAWEAEDPNLGVVHHLMVLCYHLQHPSLYSPEGLVVSKQLLSEFVEQGASPDGVRRRNRAKVDSSRRKWKIVGTPDSYGSYARPIQWPITASNVVAGGMPGYCDNVRAWAQAALDTLKTSGNM